MGFYTEITFNSVEGMFTLPLPYSGVLGPGQKAILADPPATVEANFGGKVPPVVTLTQVPDTTTPSTQSALPAAVYDLNPTQDFAIYAAVDGNDANSGLASNMAVETAIKAFSLVPPNRQSSSLKMYFGAGHFPIDCTNLRPIIFGPLSGPGPAGAISPSTQYNPFLEIIGTYQDVGLGVRTTTSPSDGTSVTDTGLSMTVDAYFGYTVRCTQGANAGQRRGIKYNTATTLDLDTPFFNTVSAGDQFVVEQPGTFFDCVGAPVFTSFGRYIMKGIQINVTPDANGNQFLAFGGGQGGGIVMLNGVIINSGTCLIPFATSAQALPLPLGSEVLDQTGVTFQNTYVVIGTDSGAGACLGGTVISDGSTLDAEGESLEWCYAKWRHRRWAWRQSSGRRYRA